MTESIMSEPRPLNILYLHHVAPFGGSSRSMLEMIGAFPAGTVNPHFVLPRGQCAEILARNQYPMITCWGVSQFDHCRYSYYRRWRWIVLIRELLYLPATLLALSAARQRWPDIDLIHVNEITMLPSTIAAKLMFGKPLLVHVRSVQCSLPTGRTRWVYKFIARFSDWRIAIDRNVQKSLPVQLSSSVIHNGLKLPNAVSDPSQRAEGELVVAMVGVIARVKGCVEFVRAAAEVKKKGLRVKFKLIGQEIRREAGWRDRLLRRLGFSQEIFSELTEIIQAEGLEQVVDFEPFTTDLQSIYSRIDVICFPSHYDAPGRPIFEAALYGIPSIAAVSEPMDDTIQPGVTGLTIPPKDHVALAAAIERFHGDPGLRRQMGQQARRFAERNFDSANNAEEALRLYRYLVEVDAKQGVLSSQEEVARRADSHDAYPDN